jgi:hypothetical protein
MHTHKAPTENYCHVKENRTAPQKVAHTTCPTQDFIVVRVDRAAANSFYINSRVLPPLRSNAVVIWHFWVGDALNIVIDRS